MMMYLLLRAFHKTADLHGLTSLLELPPCEEHQEDEQPILEEAQCDHASPPSSPRHQGGAGIKQPLEAGSQPSYNTISPG
ncbi:hypothetical protein NHX12_008584 [Muraenolepis orangiensis]|uniref:Uncharacterized protein n=1 Tax=Muraenolepis orangiensis TaxID=630683 RepID=A0A9Q0I9G9_9TELE|nr:hypothetical protein NHX12_008584 [Muraenolepis orangiensis]